MEISSKKLFSIIWTSFWLLIHYVRGLKEKHNDSGALQELFAAFWNSPRLWSVNQIEHHGGNCYVITLDQTYLNDGHGRSSLILLENNHSLPLPQTFNIQEIAEKGAGRYLHTDNQIFFSPSDNTDLTKPHNHHYQILECLVDDITTIEELLTLNKKHAQRQHSALFLIEKLRIYFKNEFLFAELKDNGDSIKLNSITLDLNSWLLGRWDCNTAEIYCRQIKTEMLWHVMLNDVSISGIDEKFTLNIELIQTLDYSLRLKSFNLKIDQQDYLYANTQLDEDGYQSIKLQFYFISSWTNLLMQIVGENETHYRIWLNQFIESLRSGNLGYKYQITEAQSRKIQSAFAPHSPINDLYLDVQKKLDSFEIVNVWSAPLEDAQA